MPEGISPFSCIKQCNMIKYHCVRSFYIEEIRLGVVFMERSNDDNTKFFFDEVRDGFFMPGMLKRAMATGFIDYQVLRKLCNSKGIHVSATFGTMIGAIRNGGYIPWDDDIDTEITRHDYIKLKKAYTNGEAPVGFILSDYNDNNNGNLVRKWLDGNSGLRDENKIADSFGFPFSNNVDIFIMDYIPEGNVALQYYHDVLDVISYVQKRFVERENLRNDKTSVTTFDEKDFRYNVNLIERVLGVKLDPDGDEYFINQLWKVMDEFCERYNIGNSDKLACIPYYMPNEDRCFPKSFYQDYIDMPFEFGSIEVPIGYDGILRTVFGNYVYPLLDFAAHEYPFYRILEQEMVEKQGHGLLRYCADLNQMSQAAEQRIIHKKKVSDSQAKDNTKREIVFLVDQVDNWRSLHSLWEEFYSDKSFLVYVIPVPYYLRRFDGSINEKNLLIEESGYPDSVVHTSYLEYDFDMHHPDAIIYQNPYDEYGDAYVVHPTFYASNLYKYTDNMVFIPPFYTREISDKDEKLIYTLGCFVKNPGVAYADMIITQSEKMKSLYSDLLGRTDGLAPEYISEEDIYGLGTPLSDWETRTRTLIKANDSDQLYDLNGCEVNRTIYDEVIEIPCEWMDKIQTEEGARRVLIYYLNASMLFEHGICEIERAKNILNIVKEYSDEYVVLWVSDPNARRILRKNNPSAWKSYQILITDISDDPDIILSGSVDEDNCAKISHAFYGDGSVLLNKCRMLGKPVLWETPGTDVKSDKGHDEYRKKWNPSDLILTEGNEQDRCSIREFLNIIPKKKDYKQTGEVGKVLYKLIIDRMEREDGRSTAVSSVDDMLFSETDEYDPANRIDIYKNIQAEVIDGFYVNSMMKRLWYDMLQDYSVLQSECKRIGGELWGAFGTLLGVIRYGGYIPWDDDIDIEMPREYMDKLKELSDKGELTNGHRILDYRSVGNDNLVRKWIEKSNSVRTKETLCDHFGFPFPSSIDIFAMDRVPGDENEKAFFFEIVKNLTYLKTIAQIIEKRQSGIPTEGAIDEKSFYDRLHKIEELLEIRFEMISDKPLSLQIMETCDAFCATYKRYECDSLVSLPYFIRDGIHVFDDRLYQEYIEMPFENSYMPVPPGYDTIMRSYFGNYMRPIHVFTGHEYPWYSSIELEIREKYGVESAHYTPSEEDIIISIRTVNGDAEEESGERSDESKQKIVFLTYRAIDWKAYHSIWKKHMSDANAEIVVIAVPYYYRDFSGNVDKETKTIETSGYPDVVELHMYDEIDIETYHPNIIYTTCPFDECDDAMTVHPYFYTKNLYRFTDRLVLIPPFYVKEIVDNDERSRISLRPFIETPGMLYSTDIYVQSEGMKKVYEETLFEFLCKNGAEEVVKNVYNRDKAFLHETIKSKIKAKADSIRIWESKSRVLFKTVLDGKYYTKIGDETTPEIYDEIVEIPNEWLDLLLKKDGSFKKILVFFISGSMLLDYGKKGIDKAKRILERFSRYEEDILIMWLTDPYAEDILKNNRSVLDIYVKTYEDFIVENKGLVVDLGGDIRSDSKDIGKLASGFYGDGCIAMNECRMRHVPVLMEWYSDEIYEPEKYEYRIWDEDMTVEDEGTWTVDNFAEEIIAYPREKQGLSVCIITKDESIKLRKCLYALSCLEVEIVVVDTGSSDDTVEMARQFTDKIYYYEWCNDFAKARNYAVSKATYDIVMTVDSDEYYLEGDLEDVIIKAYDHPEAIGQIRQKQYTSDEHGDNQESIISLARIFNRNEYHYAGSVHEQLVRGSVFDDDRNDSREMLELRKSDIISAYDTGLMFAHDGYSGEDEQRRRKAARNVMLLKEELSRYPNAADLLYQTAKSVYVAEGAEASLEFYERALSCDLDPVLFWVRDLIVCYGYVLLELEKYEQALSIEAVYDELNDSADYIFLMGLIHMNNGIFDKAKAEFIRCTGMNGDRAGGTNSFKAFYNAGVIEECLGNYESAVGLYKAAGDYSPAIQGLDRITNRTGVNDDSNI